MASRLLLRFNHKAHKKIHRNPGVFLLKIYPCQLQLNRSFRKTTLFCKLFSIWRRQKLINHRHKKFRHFAARIGRHGLANKVAVIAGQNG